MLPIQFISLFDKELQAEIESVAKIQHVQERDIIIDIGQYLKFLPILVSGSIKVVREDDEGNELFLYYVGPLETCAMSLTCCLREQKSQIRALAEEDVEMYTIPLEYVDRWMMKYPSWKDFIMSTYSRRFEELLNTIDLIAFHNMDERLLEYLKEKSRVHQSNSLEITHQEIAFDMSSSREAISRLLKKLEKMGELELHRNRIQLK